MSAAPGIDAALERDLQQFLDGTLPGPAADAMRRRLESSAALRSEADAIRKVEARLRAALRRHRAPAGLWGRIFADLAMTGVESGPPRPRGRLRRILPLVAAAGLLCFFLGAVVVANRQAPPTLPQVGLAAAPVHELQTFIASQRPLDIATSDLDRLRSWFGDKVAFLPPAFAAPQATLVGGRLSYLLGRRAAAYMYRADHHWLSLYVLPGAGLAAAGGEGVQVAGRNAEIVEIDGFTHVTWRADGLIYSVVADLPRWQLLQLAAAFGA